jgi:hypothetical protein
MSDQKPAKPAIEPRKNRPDRLASSIMQERFIANYVANGFRHERQIPRTIFTRSVITEDVNATTEERS